MNNKVPQGMKPFNLGEWQKGAKPICRNGYEPAELYYLGQSQALVFSIKYCHVEVAYKNGYINGSGYEHKYDLFLKAEKKEGWVNLYKVHHHVKPGVVYATESMAKEKILTCWRYMQTIKIEWYE